MELGWKVLRPGRALLGRRGHRMWGALGQDSALPLLHSMRQGHTKGWSSAFWGESAVGVLISATEKKTFVSAPR